MQVSEFETEPAVTGLKTGFYQQYEKRGVRFQGFQNHFFQRLETEAQFEPDI